MISRCVQIITNVRALCMAQKEQSSEGARECIEIYHLNVECKKTTQQITGNSGISILMQLWAIKH